MPGLTDGGLVDPYHPLRANFLLYSDEYGEAKSTFWFRSYDDDNGQVKHAYDRLETEGVDNLEDLQYDLQSYDFVLTEASLDFMPDEIIEANTILIAGDDLPSDLDFQRFKEVNEQILRALPEDQVQGFFSRKATVISVARTGKGEEIVTVYMPRRSGARGYLLARAFRSGISPDNLRAAIRQAVNAAGRDSRVYIFGDEAKNLDLVREVDRAGGDPIKRPSFGARRLLDTDQRLAQIGSRHLQKSSTLLVNGVPDSKEKLAQSGLPSNGVDAWKAAKSEFSRVARPHVERTVTSKQALVHELRNGSTDVVFIVAHADNLAIYLNGEALTLKELEALPPRSKRPGRPRLAVLISCNAAAPAMKASFFSLQRQSLGDLLVRKGFFDSVIAPDHEINSKEGLDAMFSRLQEEPMAQFRSNYSGWLKVAMIWKAQEEAGR